MSIIQRLTGVDLNATRAFLIRECLVDKKGFSSQYAGDKTISCTTTSICLYALSEMGLLTQQQKQSFQRLLLSFRLNTPTQQVGAFPRTTGQTASAWTTGQAALALAALGASWDVIKPSVEWLLKTQGTSGGWNFPGTNEGHERLIYTFYPAIVLARFRRRLAGRATEALTPIAAFVQSCEERDDPWWVPLRTHLAGIVAVRQTLRPEPHVALFGTYRELLEEGHWPTMRVDEDWLPERFSMALMVGPNYLHLRRNIQPNDPLSLLHIRYFAEERNGSGWSDKYHDQPKSWATALGALTLHRWAHDLEHAGVTLTRLPTRAELLVKLRNVARPALPTSPTARSLLLRLRQLRSGTANAIKYQHWVRDVMTFLFGESLKEPKLESNTFLGTQRRDITFRNAAEKGPWFDWKHSHRIDSLVIECKNTDKLRYSDLRQTAVYLGKRMGYLAIVACRKNSREDVREFLNWLVTNDEKYVLIVNDENLTDWIRLKDCGEDPTDAIADLYRWLREGAQ